MLAIALTMFLLRTSADEKNDCLSNCQSISLECEAAAKTKFYKGTVQIFHINSFHNISVPQHTSEVNTYTRVITIYTYFDLVSTYFCLRIHSKWTI